MRAFLNLRFTVPERRAAFEAGLKRLGYEVAHGTTGDPGPRDVFLTWNRIGDGDRRASLFEARGLPVLVAENAAWGNELAGEHWYSLARNHHNMAGMAPDGGRERWDLLRVELAPWRTEGETVILPQRGIGSPPVAMPRSWPGLALQRYGGRIRPHPGRSAGVPLEHDLKQCGRAVTWGSGAAVKALIMGVPVISEMPNWIGEQDNTDAGRLAMFRRLAWAQWRLSEIADGSALRWMLSA